MARVACSRRAPTARLGADRCTMMRLFGNVLAIAGCLVGVLAAYLWCKAANTPATYNMDSIIADLQAIGETNKRAALVTESP